MPREHPLPHPRTEAIEELTVKARILLKEKGEVRQIKNQIAEAIDEAREHLRTVEQMSTYEKRYNAMKLSEYLNDLKLVAGNVQFAMPKEMEHGLDVIARHYELLRTEGSQAAQAANG